MNKIIAFPGQCKADTINAQDAIARHLPELAAALDGVKLKTTIMRDSDTVSRGDGSCHIVVAGCLKKTRIDAAGDAHIDGFYYPGDLISGEFIDSTQCCVIAAYETVCLVSVPMKELLETGNSELLTAVIFGLAEELKHANTLSFYVAKKSATVRLAWFLHTLWSKYSRQFASCDATEIYMPMRRCDIASYLGLAAETVSRELTHLSRSALICVDKRTVRINKLDALAKVADINLNDTDTKTRAMH